MRLYLDDDIASALLPQLLRNAGHDVQIPSDVGKAGKEDPVHLTQAIDEGRVFLSRNYRDFEHLHVLILRAQGHHPGILLVRRDDNTKRNMSPRDIVQAIHNLETANVHLIDQCYVLNHWQ